MRHLHNLFNGKLTAYQIATATDIDIHHIESVMEGSMALDAMAEEDFRKLAELEEDLFTSIANKNETSA
ncbi:hypothetical protein [Macrococcus carouselicus]|uniref:Uncharacterized protein n=1 Tax=Macrococcus carouselicus TaxID=69969 RepID=A0A9Q8FSL2_9STAP|nr:hypothetical protein [Macrococcus carouselicus]TDM04549.1 hypothetical protein ERX40_05080 [Macrococcus carouselicus]